MSNQFEFRAATEDELKDVVTSVNYAFAEDNEDTDWLKPEWTLCAFDGSKVAATSGYFPFQMSFNGQVVKNAAITIVTSEPEYRRKGLVRRLMTDCLHQAKEEGYGIATLWASMGALYQRYGYGLASHFNHYSVDPRFSDFRVPFETKGTPRRMGQDEAMPIIKGIFEASMEGRTLDNLRSDSYWDMIFGQKDKKDRHFLVWFDEEGKPTGYATYRQKDKARDDAGPTLEIMISDFIWLDMDAYHGMWSFFRSHDLAQSLKFYFVPDDDPAPHLLLEPRMLNKKQSDGIWLRVVDVAQALGERGYNQSGSVTITIKDDDLCSWNNGSWSVSAEGDGSCGTVKEASGGGLIMNPNTLASLISGFASASFLARIGHIECGDPAQLIIADALFSTASPPYCSMEF